MRLPRTPRVYGFHTRLAFRTIAKSRVKENGPPPEGQAACCHASRLLEAEREHDEGEHRETHDDRTRDDERLPRDPHPPGLYLVHGKLERLCVPVHHPSLKYRRSKKRRSS